MVPANTGDVGSMVAQAMAIWHRAQAKGVAPLPDAKVEASGWQGLETQSNSAAPDKYAEEESMRAQAALERTSEIDKSA